MITPSHNPRIQQVRALLGRAKDRQEAGEFVVEGVRLAEEAWQSGRSARLVLFSQKLSQRGREVVVGLAAGGAEVEEVAEQVLAALSDTENSQGILAILPREPGIQLPAALDFVVIADTIRDPGNLGTLLRTAAAAGAQAALLSPGCADPFSPKVLRAAMGAHFHLPILEMEWTEIRASLKHPSAPLQVFLADIQANLAYWQVDLRCPLAIMVSNEAQGASPEGRALADQMLLIPMPGKSESLNAAVAAGIVLFEVVRQRTLKSRPGG
jgi:RNA methyltransferase, TrmH family